MTTRELIKDRMFSARTYVNSRLKNDRVYLQICYQGFNSRIAAIDPFDFTPDTAKKDRQLALKLARVAIEKIGLKDPPEILNFISNYFECKRRGIEGLINKREQKLQEMYAQKEEYDRANRLLNSKR